jgi:general stress protein 26
MSYIEVLVKDNSLVLITVCLDGTGHGIVVNSEGIRDEKLILFDSMMDTTLENIKRNPKVCVIASSKGEYYRIKGTAKIISSGKIFEDAVSAQSGSYKTKNVIEISVEEVFDLDKAQKVL